VFRHNTLLQRIMEMYDIVPVSALTAVLYHGTLDPMHA